jgi:GNAT superfamily N-acetyltransferase
MNEIGSGIVDFELRALSARDLPRARALLAASCEFDAAADVAEEKLFGPAPRPGDATPDPPAVIGAMRGDYLVGLAATSHHWIRLLAVHPTARRQGVGSALLAAAESRIAAKGCPRARILDQPGNYLAPGIDARNQVTLAWLERRGYARLGENTNLLVDVASNPKVSAARAAELAAQPPVGPGRARLLARLGVRGRARARPEPARRARGDGKGGRAGRVRRPRRQQ